MKMLSNRDLKDLVGRTEPCITVYSPVSNDHATNQARLQLLVDEAFTRARDVFPIVAPHFDGLSASKVLDEIATKQKVQGVAIFKSALFLGIKPIYKETEPLVVVSDSFHLMPFFNQIQMQEKYTAIWLEAHRVRVYKGDSTGLELNREFETQFTFNPTQNERAPLEPITRTGGGTASRIKALQNDKKTLVFFKEIESKLRSSPLGSIDPIILVGEPKLVKLYKRFNKYRSPIILSLLQNQLLGPTKDEVHQKALQVLEEFYQRRALSGVEEYRIKRAMGTALDNLSAIAKAAAKGNVKSLLIRSGTFVFGKLSKNSGSLSSTNLNAASPSDNVLDDIGELVLKKSGQVFVLGESEMPTREPVAAILNHQMRAIS